MGWKPALSATLIVRDEEAYLGSCLDSITRLVDEIVVVDTGSTDSSRAIAAAHGARTFEFRWQDDFSAARNFALDQATGDWILYIDADEQVRPYHQKALANELSDRRLCAATVRFCPQTGYTAYPELRLFRRDPRIRFQSAIHETIVPSIAGLVAAGEGRVGPTQLTIDHFGYDGDQRAKHSRNLPLLLKQVEVHPGRIYLWWHLGMVYQALGRDAEADAAWWEGVMVARNAAVHTSEEALCFIELAKFRMLKGEDALPLIRQGLQMQPNSLLLQWLQARALVLAERIDEATPIFERLALIDPETLLTEAAYNKRILGASAFAEIGYCAFLRGRYRESEEWYHRAELLDPERVEFRVKRRLAASRAGGPGGGARSG
jgi:glycosyltransferase involved in cell wall biosynthesis